MSSTQARSPFSLEGLTILVTGASSGIGRATAVLCSGMGAKVVLTGRDQSRLAETMAGMYGDGHGIYGADLTNMDERNALVDSLPAIDGCAFCAGAAELVPVRMVSERHFTAMMDINFTAPVMLTQRLLYRKKLRDHASLVYVTAITDRSSPIATAMYSAAKGALTAFSRTVALEHAKQGMRANCVAPGYVDTPMLTKLKSTVLSNEKVDLTPLGSVAASDVANGMVYLLSPASRWATRSALVIDGGLSLPMR
jgi:NAD(P)-dependent dehydrogenase (short-subunit alcohol dehydrogenase family)